MYLETSDEIFSSISYRVDPLFLMEQRIAPNEPPQQNRGLDYDV